MLDGFDEEQRKYIEAGTGGLHTKERCQEAKAKLEQKNDHGNETVYDIIPPKQEFVDHTAGTKGYFKAFAAPTIDELNEVANSWLRIQNVRFKQWGQLQVTKDGFAIAVYYEEITKQ